MLSPENRESQSYPGAAQGVSGVGVPQMQRGRDVHRAVLPPQQQVRGEIQAIT